MSLGKGIKLSSGFDLNSKSPLDNRTVFEDIVERDRLPDINKYEGLICYVKSKKINYQYLDGQWKELKETLSEGMVGDVDKAYVDEGLLKKANLDYTNNELNKKSNKGHIHSYGELEGLPIIPSKTSEIVNDSGYITIEDVDTSQNHIHTNKKVLDSLDEQRLLDWDSKSNFDGDYNSLTNKPVIDVDKAYVDEGLKNKSDIVHGHSYNDLTDKPDLSNIGVSKDYVDSELEKKANIIHTHNSGEIDYLNSSDSTIKTVQDALDKLMYFDLKIDMSCDSPLKNEMGSTIRNPIFSWSYNKNITSQTFDGESLDVSSRSHSPNVSIVNSRGFTLRTDDGKKIFTKTISFEFLNGRYWGVSSLNEYNSSFIQKLNKELASNKNKTFTADCRENQHIYYCIPSAFGTPTFTVGGFAGGFGKVETISYTNQNGHIENYDIWKSTNSNLGNTTVVVS